MNANAVKAKKSRVGDVVHTVSAVDPDLNNVVTYSMTQDPDLGYFDINTGH